MQISVCFLAIVCSAVALPAEIPFEALEELDLSKLTPKNVYLEPINPVKPADLPSSRIVGGTELAPGAAPYQVAIIADSSGFCGGSLISPSSVLTAAHCTIRASYVQVRVGAHNYNQDETTQVRLTSANIINHELFDDSLYLNDIAVVFLPSAVSLTDSIGVVDLAPVSASTYAGSWGLLAGWGITTDSSANVAVSTLRGVYLNVITNVECRSIYGSTVLDSHLCTSGAGIAGGCSGDNGGPLVIDGVQVGLVAFFPIRCENGNPTGFTRISSFRSWIAQNAGV